MPLVLTIKYDQSVELWEGDSLIGKIKVAKSGLNDAKIVFDFPIGITILREGLRPLGKTKTHDDTLEASEGREQPAVGRGWYPMNFVQRESKQ